MDVQAARELAKRWNVKLASYQSSSKMEGGIKTYHLTSATFEGKDQSIREVGIVLRRAGFTTYDGRKTTFNKMPGLLVKTVTGKRNRT